MKQPPCVFCHKCIIKKGEIFKTHTTLRFRLTQVLPLNPMNLPIITPLTPKKSAYHNLMYVFEHILYKDNYLTSSYKK